MYKGGEKMVDLVYIIQRLGLFLKTSFLETIPLGTILVCSLSVGGIIKLAQARMRGGK